MWLDELTVGAGLKRTSREERKRGISLRRCFRYPRRLGGRPEKREELARVALSDLIENRQFEKGIGGFSTRGDCGHDREAELICLDKLETQDEVRWRPRDEAIMRLLHLHIDGFGRIRDLDSGGPASRSGILTRRQRGGKDHMPLLHQRCALRFQGRQIGREQLPAGRRRTLWRQAHLVSDRLGEISMRGGRARKAARFPFPLPMGEGG